ncbi:MAG TPA: L-lactate permease [Anaerolineaceae bacterium]|nr:L-lactate permease [Anaerolineaceae bacterium]HQH85447.1 L-lactate permease [Anaerolineaceae bacterium]
MPLTLLTWLLALLPVLVILVLMLGLKWGGSKAGAVGLVVALLVAVVFFGAGGKLIAVSQGKGLLLTFDVLYIIWTALLLFHIADEAGAVRIIGQALPRLTTDRMMQGLLLGWLFASFLQGMGGFGVPVAVAAPLLVGLGFSPVQAVIMACIGHGWAVNFGSLATSFQTLMAVTGLPGELLAPDSALLLGLSAIACGSVVAFVAAGWKGLLRALPAVLVLSAVMGGVQYLLVTNGLWTLGATGGAMAGLIVGIGVARLPLYHGPAAQSEHPQAPLVAFSAYAVLILLAFGINLIPPVNALLDSIQVNFQFPAVSTAFGWATPAEPGRAINIFGHPGALLLYSSIIAYLIYARAGYYKPGALPRILRKTYKGAVNSSLGILAMVGMAVIMSHSGMTNLLAQGLSVSFGAAVYPAVAPFIGALGAFITGSNNNSNVLFAALQMRTAELLGLDVPLILGAQTAGGSLGSVMAPAKVIVGCSTVGLGSSEGVVMGKILIYGLIPVALVAVLVLFF